jgi:hypothetical protein
MGTWAGFEARQLLTSTRFFDGGCEGLLYTVCLRHASANNLAEWVSPGEQRRRLGSEEAQVHLLQGGVALS